MRIFLRTVLTILAVFGVGVLGYYAYSLSFSTLSYSFHGTDSQNGTTLVLVTHSPHMLKRSTETYTAIDEEALRQTIRVGSDSRLLSDLVSGEYSITVSGEVAYMDFPQLKDGESVAIDADAYNKLKHTAYRLPKSLQLTNTSQVARGLDVTRIGDPGLQTYHLSIYGMDKKHTPSDVRYYMHTRDDLSCNLLEAWKYMIPVSGETQGKLLKTGVRLEQDVKLTFPTGASRLCVIAGLGGKFQIIEDRRLTPFSGSITPLAVLSPEIDMKSQLAFSFSSPIFSDTGALYSKEYLDKRTQEKKNFLEKLTIGNIPLTLDDIILTPDRAIITTSLTEGKNYRIKLDKIQDIYGRVLTLSDTLVPKQEPHLSIHLNGSQTVYRSTDSVDAKIFSLGYAESVYSLKMCRVSLESYSRLERIVSERDKKYAPDTFALLSDPENTSDCVKRDVEISGSGYVTSIHLDDLLSGGSVLQPGKEGSGSVSASLKPGLYMVAFADQEILDRGSYGVKPLVFSVVDTHITLKTDVSGNMFVFATDLATGKPLADQEIRVMRNMTQMYRDTWDDVSRQSVREYLPLSMQAFATGVILGKTDARGILEISLPEISDPENSLWPYTPYELSFESWWDYEGRYDSFLAQSSDNSGRYGVVVSTWNDGITGFNFGLKESDYSWMRPPEYNAYIYTDRRLYLPGEDVHIRGIIRAAGKNGIEAREGDAFAFVVTDPYGKEVKRAIIKTNHFGSIWTDMTLDPESPTGLYTISLTKEDSYTAQISGAYQTFQVEIFKNPTFTSTVTLKTDGLDADSTLKLVRAESNQDESMPWYDTVYKGQFVINGIVKSSYYNGALIKSMPFRYRVYRSEHFSDTYFSDCFWGCYYNPPIEFYTEGNGSIDSDGYGVFRIPIDYRSFSSDYTYTVEVIVRDPATGEEVTTPQSIVVKLPEKYKTFGTDPLQVISEKNIVSDGEIAKFSVTPKYGNWDHSLEGKYSYELYFRTYDEVWVDDIRSGKVRITHPKDTKIQEGVIQSGSVYIDTKGFSAGEYHLRTIPVAGTVDPGVLEKMTSDTTWYISGDFSLLGDTRLRVIPDKTVYTIGETARVLVQVPFTGSTVLFTKERGGVLSSETFTLTGNTFTRELMVDETFEPNLYVSAVAIAGSGTLDLARSYAVGYSEIVVDKKDKQAVLAITPDKQTYMVGDTVSVGLHLTDRSGKPLVGEVSLMVVDESLIRLIGNIDLDILPKFFQKYPFTLKTALSYIGIERNRYLSRKGSSGGSGDKGGNEGQIASRNIFKNTVYYSPSIVTDVAGNAKVDFPLADTISEYRIIGIANTVDTHIAVREETIQVRKNYVLETHAPLIVRQGDVFSMTVQAFNMTKNITGADMKVHFGSGNGMTQTGKLILQPGESGSLTYQFTVDPDWQVGQIPYTVELSEKGVVLDSITKSIGLVSLPILENTYRSISIMTGSTLTLELPKALSGTDMEASRLEVGVSPSFGIILEDLMGSLLVYPYGCVEQTVASTLPNAFALRFADRLNFSIDQEMAQKNLASGVKKILSMQQPDGTWVYWQGSSVSDLRITPHMVRSLVLLRELGADIPETAIQSGVAAIIQNRAFYESETNAFAEAVWTLAYVRDPAASEWYEALSGQTLGRHARVVQLLAADHLGLSTDPMRASVERILETDTSYGWWYMDILSDRALYIQSLLSAGKLESAQQALTLLSSDIDVSSYFVSTMTKMQYLTALAKEMDLSGTLKKPVSVALRGEKIIADLSAVSPILTARTAFNRLQAGNVLNIESKNNAPLYITLRIQDRMKDIFSTPSVGDKGIRVTRTLEMIDESRGVDSSGNFRSATVLNDGKLKKGSLYRITLGVDTSDLKDYQHLVVEDFFPGGYRPIQSVFKTTSRIEGEAQDGWWDHTEVQSDRLFADIFSGYGNKKTFTYYVRPEFVGTYILPPATSYLMYHPEIYAMTEYQKIEITD